MSKYQVIFYQDGTNARYSYFVKVPNMSDVSAESYLSVEVLTRQLSHLGIDIGEILTRKVK